MDALSCIYTRRSHRRFLSREIPRPLLEKIVEAGRCAPSGGNCQSFHFLVITNREVLGRLARLVREAFAGMEVREEMYASLQKSIRRAKEGEGYVFHYDAPALIVVANRKDYPNAMADSACALENMMLAANALELGSCWINQLHWLDSACGMTGEHPRVEAALRELGLGEDETVCGALSVGYVEQLNRNETPRKSVVDFIS